MRTWTLVFLAVVGLAVLAIGESSWNGVLWAARMGFAAMVVAALLVGVRAMTRQMTLPPRSACTPGGSHPRPSVDDVVQARARAARTGTEGRFAAARLRALEHAEEGKAR